MLFFVVLQVCACGDLFLGFSCFSLKYSSFDLRSTLFSRVQPCARSFPKFRAFRLWKKWNACACHRRSSGGWSACVAGTRTAVASRRSPSRVQPSPRSPSPSARWRTTRRTRTLETLAFLPTSTRARRRWRSGSCTILAGSTRCTKWAFDPLFLFTSTMDKDGGWLAFSAHFVSFEPHLSCQQCSSVLGFF